MAEGEQKDPDGIGDVVGGLDELADENDSEVSLGDVLEKFGARSFAPLMMVFALIELSPIGAIPGVPTFLALCIAIVAVQMLMGRDHIWVPSWIKERSVSSEKMHKATEKMEGIADKLDNLVTDRLGFLASQKIAAVVILLLCLTVAPLEVLPWAAAGPMLAIAIISLGLIVGDGLIMLIAYLFGAAAASGAAYFLLSGGSGSGSGSGGGFLFF